MGLLDASPQGNCFQTTDFTCNAKIIFILIERGVFDVLELFLNPFIKIKTTFCCMFRTVYGCCPHQTLVAIYFFHVLKMKKNCVLGSFPNADWHKTLILAPKECVLPVFHRFLYLKMYFDQFSRVLTPEFLCCPAFGNKEIIC